MAKTYNREGKMVKIELDEYLSFDKDSNFCTLSYANHFNGIKDCTNWGWIFQSFSE